jgi:hypothetical protein
MEPSPSWEAANGAATHKFPNILRNPKVHYRVKKSPSLVPVLSNIDPVHTIPSYLSKIYFNSVHSPTSWSSYWSLSFWLSHQYPICIPLLTNSCYMHRPSHPPWLDHSNYVWRGLHIMKLLIMQFFFQSPITSSLFSPDILTSAPCSQTPSVCVFPLMSDTKFCIHTKPQVKL